MASRIVQIKSNCYSAIWKLDYDGVDENKGVYSTLLWHFLSIPLTR